MKKKVLISLGLGILFLGSLFVYSAKESKFFTREVLQMTKEDSAYTVQTLTQEESGFDVTNFSIDPRIVDSLHYTEREIRNSCSSASDRARKYIPTFVSNGTPRLDLIKGKVFATIPILVDSKTHNEMFIVGEVTREGKALPMRVVREVTFN